MFNPIPLEIHWDYINVTIHRNSMTGYVERNQTWKIPVAQQSMKLMTGE